METRDSATAQRTPTETIDLAIRIGLLALLAWLSLQVFRPFLGLMVWAVVLAIAVYPVNARLASKLGGSNGRAATLMVLALVLVLGVPTVLLGISLFDDLLSTYRGIQAGTLQLPAPEASVKDWPVVGERVYAAWQAASTNIVDFAQTYQQQLREYAERAAASVGGLLTTLLLFIVAFIIAGIMMAYAEPGAATTRRIYTRIGGPEIGPQLHQLTVDTVRSVAVGVVGVAFIQAVLLGIGFILGGVPFAGLLALVTLVLAIVQVPAALVFLPVIAWLWTKGDASTVVNVLLTVYLFVAGLSDNVLKPMLLGRGLSVPMPVILLGALGGMVSAGLIGLFVGAVVLAVGYQIFMGWVAVAEPGAQPAPDAAAGEAGD